MFRIAMAFVIWVLASTGSEAGEHEIRMVTTEAGEMVFEPDFVRAEPGDTIRFIPASPMHNAETIRGMIPEGAEPFKAGISEDFTVTLDQEGLYGIVCKSHYAVGMVMTVVVGEPVNLEAAMKWPHPLKAKAVFKRHFDMLLAN